MKNITASPFSENKDYTATYLGFDLSTQKLKAVQLGNDLRTLATAEVQFDTDLNEFQTTGGVIIGSVKYEFFAQPTMWIKALDMIMDRLVMNGADLSTVAAIGGSAQQHGSVYWSSLGIDILRNLNSNKFLHVQLNDSAFTINRTPIWMDGSTEKQCSEMELAIGGRTEMVSITGSKCYARFTGPQIRKIYQQYPHAYDNTARISLVSSFLASIFIGDVAPIDFADASGMNLFDIKTKIWSKKCLNACAPDLEKRLGTPVSTNTIIGNLSDYFVQRFGMSPECKIAAFTGDNPSVLSGMLIRKNWLIISLGTSDTLMMNLEKPTMMEEGHVLCHPCEEGQFMGLLCFRNGSLVRDQMKLTKANNNWNTFSELLDSTPRGNYGNMALHFPAKEIIPAAKGTLRWGKYNNLQHGTQGVTKFSSAETEIRALIEGQMLHRRAIATDMGFDFNANTKLIATGGASINTSILQVIADVFNAPVYVQNGSEAALLGAAYRAKYVHYLSTCKSENFSPQDKTRNGSADTISSYSDFIHYYIPEYLRCVCLPSRDSDEVYKPMIERYRDMAYLLQRNL